MMYYVTTILRDELIAVVLLLAVALLAEVAMVLAETSPLPGPDEVRGQGFFGDTAEEAEQMAKVFLGMSEPTN